MDSQHLNSAIILTDEYYLGFDNHALPQKLKHSNNSTWLATCRFQLIHVPPATTQLSTKNHLYQSDAVRLLLNKLIKQMPSVLANSDASCKPDTIWLDESAYPYRLKPLDYYVSFTHSKSQIACAISKIQPIGIDIETKQIPFKIAKRFYNHDEIKWLATLESNTRQQATNLLWMLKEAHIKKYSNPNNPIILTKALKNNLIIPAQKLLNQPSIESFKNINSHNIFAEIKTYTDHESTQNHPKTNNSYVYIPNIQLVLAL